MIDWIFEQLLGGLFKYFTGLWAARQAKAETVRADVAEAKAAQENEVIKHEEDRHAIDQQINAMPEAPVQRVGDAAPDSAAGKLREWTRD